jgi:cilia- and flagella-associated protein 300
VSDELRKCLLMEEFDSYSTFSAEDRKEFIFHIFKALCLGGRLCQFEDSAKPYLEATKKTYKDLIRLINLITAWLKTPLLRS